MSDVRLVLTTVGDAEAAARLASRLVEARLAACVSVQPGLRSTYRWKGEVVTEDELLVLIKTSVQRLDELRRVLLEEHPYEVPEFLALDVGEVPEAYAAWLRDATGGG